jgi:hypothetical protein
LNWGADKVKALGLGVIRVEMGAQRSYGLGPTPIEGDEYFLVKMAQTPEYRALFENPQFHTYLLTTYTAQALAQVWAGGMADLALERATYRNLARYLAATYPGKKLILLNWEGDNELYWHPGRAAEFQAFLQARIDGIREAGAANVFSGIEFNCAYDGEGGICDEARVVKMIPALGPDYIGWSSWPTINRFVYSSDPAALEQGVMDSIDRILTTTGYWGGDLILGEFGRESDTVIEPYTWFRTVDRALRKKEVKLAIYWQTVEDVQPLGYGLYDADGVLTDNGRALQQLTIPLVIKWPGSKW